MMKLKRGSEETWVSFETWTLRLHERWCTGSACIGGGTCTWLLTGVLLVTGLGKAYGTVCQNLVNSQFSEGWGGGKSNKPCCKGQGIADTTLTS